MKVSAVTFGTLPPFRKIEEIRDL